MKVALVLNTRVDESEFQVEYDPPHTIKLIKHGIQSAGHEYVFIEADENFVTHLKEQKPDLVFNRAEGIRGESRESHVPAMLEMLEIPYVGSNVLTTALCLNKGWTKKILKFHEILTPNFTIVNNIFELTAFNFRYPVILKPNEEGSSVGINEDNVINNSKELKSKLTQILKVYEQGILIEEFIQGREFSVGVLGTKEGTLEVLSIIEIDFSQFPKEVGTVFGQRAKTLYDSLDHYICPAKIPDAIKKKLEAISLQVCDLLEIKDFARIDFRMNSAGEIFFLEINPLPGIDFDLDENDFSFYPYMAFKSGYTYDQLIQRLIDSACTRYNLS
ncbi:MAG: ATP-grasp domain-containing protein [Promethearchaeota archaeon]